MHSMLIRMTDEMYETLRSRAQMEYLTMSKLAVMILADGLSETGRSYKQLTEEIRLKQLAKKGLKEKKR